MDKLHILQEKMVQYDSKDPKRIHHFLKVHSFAKWIGQEEGLDKETMEILEAAALVHDIGIKNAEKKYGSSAGNLQEKEGPPEVVLKVYQGVFRTEAGKRMCREVYGIGE